MLETRSGRVGLVIVTFGLLAAGVTGPAVAAEKDVNGTWSYFVGPRPPDGRLARLVLKREGEKLTGKVTLPGGKSQEIQGGRVTGDRISFFIQLGPNGAKVHHSGEVTGDTIKGKTEFEPPGGPKRAHFDWHAERTAD
jgi:hypothetical protein